MTMINLFLLIFFLVSGNASFFKKPTPVENKEIKATIIYSGSYEVPKENEMSNETLDYIVLNNNKIRKSAK
jgi:hypothetical protein